MLIRLEAITSDDPRTTAALTAGEVVEHAVELSVDGRRRVFRVHLRAKLLAGFDASIIHGEPLLEELLRFEPQAASALFAAVGRFRRGEAPPLPLVLIDTGSADLGRSASGR